MDLAVVTPEQFFYPLGLELEGLLVVALVYTVLLVTLGYFGAVLWHKFRDGRKREA